MTRTRGGLGSRLRGWWDLLAAEFAKFGAIGAIGVFVDSGAYLALTVGVGVGGAGVLDGHEKIASLVATGIATLYSWVANRHWTFRHRRPANLRREVGLFLFFNAIGALITMGCNAIAIDVFHVTDPSGQTAARLVGIVLGTIFRFWTYRQFVFVRELADLPPVPGEDYAPRHRAHGAAGGPAGPSAAPVSARDAESRPRRG